MQVFHTGSITESDFEQIVSVLNAGNVVVFPTDTAYGLAADPFSATAIARLFAIKGRPETKPILLLIDSLEGVESVAITNTIFFDVARRFWPGPLTMILPALPHLSRSLTAGTGTIGVRWPDAGFATRLVREFGKPVTATSANRSGMPACVTADEVRAQLDDSVPILIDGGELPSRGGSTLLDLTIDPPVVLRHGPISFDTLHAFFGGALRSQVT